MSGSATYSSASYHAAVQARLEAERREQQARARVQRRAREMGARKLQLDAERTRIMGELEDIERHFAATPSVAAGGRLRLVTIASLRDDARMAGDAASLERVRMRLRSLYPAHREADLPAEATFTHQATETGPATLAAGGDPSGGRSPVGPPFGLPPDPEARPELAALAGLPDMSVAPGPIPNREVAQDGAPPGGAAGSPWSALLGARARLAGLEGDEVALAWCGDEISCLAQTVKEASAALDTGEVDRTAALLASFEGRVEELLARAEARQAVEQRRLFLVRGIEAALKRMGFKVESVGWLRPGDRDSDVVVKASRRGRDRIDACVGLDGDVAYETDGFGGAGRACDEGSARRYVSRLNALLETTNGIRLSEVLWQPATRRKDRSARQVPAANAAKGSGRP